MICLYIDCTCSANKHNVATLRKKAQAVGQEFSVRAIRYNKANREFAASKGLGVPFVYNTLNDKVSKRLQDVM